MNNKRITCDTIDTAKFTKKTISGIPHNFKHMYDMGIINKLQHPTVAWYVLTIPVAWLAIAKESDVTSTNIIQIIIRKKETE